MKIFVLSCFDLVYGGTGTCKCFDSENEIVKNIIMSPKYSFDIHGIETCSEGCCKQPRVLKWEYISLDGNASGNCPKK
jgi:hypothetical protein